MITYFFCPLKERCATQCDDCAYNDTGEKHNLKPEKMVNTELKGISLPSGWISIKDAIPPLNKGVLITDATGKVSFGRISKISMGYPATGNRDPVTVLEWRSIEPHVFDPTHWRPLPAVELKK